MPETMKCPMNPTFIAFSPSFSLISSDQKQFNVMKMKNLFRSKFNLFQCLDKKRRYGLNVQILQNIIFFDGKANDSRFLFNFTVTDSRPVIGHVNPSPFCSKREIATRLLFCLIGAVHISHPMKFTETVPPNQSKGPHKNHRQGTGKSK